MTAFSILPESDPDYESSSLLILKDLILGSKTVEEITRNKILRINLLAWCHNRGLVYLAGSEWKITRKGFKYYLNNRNREIPKWAKKIK